MNPDGPFPQHKEPSLPEDKKSNSPLGFTPDQARREARKLHELRDDLKTRRSVQDTAIRSSPIGNDN
jgi:hypothetical protein